MRQDRISHILAPALVLVALAALMVVLGLVVAGPAHAGTKATETPKAKAASPAKTKSPAAKASRSPSGEPAIVLQRGAEVQFGEDVVVPAGTTTPLVVAFGGDITVDGTVTDAVVAFGGNVTIRGTVGTSTVAFGGDVTVGPDAVLGSDLKPSDASLVLFGGKLTQAPGAEVVGQTQTFQGVDVGGAFGLAAKGIFIGPGLQLLRLGVPDRVLPGARAGHRRAHAGRAAHGAAQRGEQAVGVARLGRSGLLRRSPRWCSLVLIISIIGLRWCCPTCCSCSSPTSSP